MPSLIPLFDVPSGPPSGAGPRILQLYQDLELFSEGDPPANALFVLGRSLGVVPDQAGLWRDQLLIVDPPPNLEARFRLEGDVAVLYTTEETGRQDAPGGFARVQTMAGGVAHIRIGEQFLDIYSQRARRRRSPARYRRAVRRCVRQRRCATAPGRGLDGEEELDTLRLIARILKGHHFQLYIPYLGAMVQDKLAVMERLAADVAYLHGLRRVIPALVARGESWEMIETVGESLLPAAMQSPAAKAVHTANLRTLSTRP